MNNECIAKYTLKHSATLRIIIKKFYFSRPRVYEDVSYKKRHIQKFKNLVFSIN